MKVRRRETFDSSATPTSGRRRVEPRALAAVDLEALEERMAATIERAAAEDPKALRRRIIELERQLREAEERRPEPIVERVEVPVPVVPTPAVEVARAMAEQANRLVAELECNSPTAESPLAHPRPASRAAIPQRPRSSRRRPDDQQIAGGISSLEAGTC